MSIQDKIKVMRKIKHWSQEEVANKLNMATNTYASIERGESDLKFKHLEKMAEIFEIDLIELINNNDKNLVCLINDNSDYSANYYGNDNILMTENNNLKNTLFHKEEIIQQLRDEIIALKEIISLLKQNN